jgi:3-methyladenine DNA glycosylase AlkD
MNKQEIIKKLESLGNETVRKLSARSGAGDKQFGVKSGDIRNLAKQIKPNTEFALELWQTDNLDVQMLAILLMKPKEISADQLEKMVKAVTSSQLADWLNPYIVKLHPDKEKLREKWMKATNPMLSRSAWSLTAERIMKNPEGLDIPALLERIEKEMADAPEFVQWTMNGALAQIGISFPEYRERAIAIGEKLGVYRDYPTSKGCISPFAPIWITELSKR